MHLLTAIDGRARNDDANHRANRLMKRTAGCFDHLKRRIVCGIADKDYFERRIVLGKETGNVFFQALVDAAARDKDRNEWSEFTNFLRQLALHIANKTQTAAQRKQAEPDCDCSKEIEDQQNRVVKHAYFEATGVVTGCAGMSFWARAMNG